MILMTILIICIGVIIGFFMYNRHLKKRIELNENNNHKSKNVTMVETESMDSFSTFPAKPVENDSKLSNKKPLMSHVINLSKEACDDNIYEDPKADARSDENDENEYENPRVDSRSM